MSSTKSIVAGLYVQSGEKQKLAFPLKHIEVKAKIAGNLSRVEVTQQFENPFEEPLEATYIFPLPDEAAVDEMEIKIGDRLIKGNIKKRAEAQQIYREAKQQGRTAALLEQQRDNVFTQSLANIKPGEEIDVIIRYTDSLKFEGGDYEFVFPMVVGPRYIPGTIMDGVGNTDEVPDAAEISPPVLPPGTRSGRDIGVTVEIDVGMSVSNIHSTSHQIQTSENNETITVTLNVEDTIPNKDLILRYRVAGEKAKATVLTQADSRGGHFALYLIPALQYRSEEIVPKDVVFLIDTSGSQSGKPISQCKQLMRRFINGLNPEDTFTVIDFATVTTKLSEKPLPNTQENRDRALKYIDRLTAGGGTEMLNGIREVLKFPAAPLGRLRSIVMLTDGYIGNEKAVLAEVQKKLKPGNRLYSFGAGASVNRFLLNRLAEVGRGVARVVRHDEPIGEVTRKFFEQINNPVLTQIEVEWRGRGKSPEIYPLPAPDLFAEQPLVLFGRKEDAAAGELLVKGIAAGGETYQRKFEIDFAEGGNAAVAQLWGRQRIKFLTNSLREAPATSLSLNLPGRATQMFDYEKKSKVEAVTEIALTYQLLSEYTAFVAVSEDVRVEPGGKSLSVEVPVEMPDGMDFAETFDDELEEYSLMVTPSWRPRYYARSASFESSSKMPLPKCGAPQGMFSDDLIKLLLRQVKKLVSRLGRAINGLKSLLSNGFKKPKRSTSQETAPSAKAPWLEVATAKGLEDASKYLLARHLQKLEIAEGVRGEIVLELEVKGDRVVRVVVDDEGSSLSDRATLEAVKRSLLQWQLTFPGEEKIEVVLVVA